VRYALSVSLSFPASHQIIGHPQCSRRHGHLWTVKATASHEEMRSGYPMGSSALDVPLRAVVSELAFSDLQEMGAPATPPALAAWFFERIAAFAPTLTEVSVWNEFEGGTVGR